MVPNFCFNWQFWFFLLDLSKKDFSDLKQKKWTPYIYYIILRIQISLVRNFSSNWQFWFFRANLPQKVFPVDNRNSEPHHGIQHIWIGLGRKFQLKLIILDQIYPEEVNKQQSVQGLQAFTFYIVNVNSTVVFKHFEDLKDFIILNILKEKLVMSCLLGSFYLKLVWSFSSSTVQIAVISRVMIKFWSKFEFQIPLQLYRTVDKVETFDGNGQTFWEVPPSFQPSHFGYYFVFSWSRFRYTEKRI